jgi:hypothetical protein
MKPLTKSVSRLALLLLLVGLLIFPPTGAEAMRLSEPGVPAQGADLPFAPDQDRPQLDIFPGHPRLILGGYRGPSLEDLRAACDRPEMQGECARIGGKHLLDDAMAWLLTEDAAALGRAKALLLAGVSAICSDGYEQSPAGGHALAYDWLWPALSASERLQVESGLAACGERMAASLAGNSPHLWHGYGSQAAALALIALALDAPPEGLREAAQEFFRERALEGYALTGGAWPEGYNYLRSHFFSGDPPYQYVIDAIRAWDTAVEQDHVRHARIFETIAAEEGDWLSELGWHLYYGTLPPHGPEGKRSLLRGGDMPTGQAWPYKQYRPFVDAIARAYGDPWLADWGRAAEAEWGFVGGSGSYHSIHRYSLPYALPDASVPTRPPLPLSRIWAREDHGQILARSDWSDAASVLGYRAGKWMTGHQHMDQGHVDLWHRGPLLVDAGVYAGWGTEHREAWYIRTVAHNSLLVPMPGERFDQHPGFATPVDDAGQRILTYRGCPQCMQSVAEWRSNIGAGLHLEAGQIERFEDDDLWLSISSDLTSAYNSNRYAAPGQQAKVELVQRDLNYLRPGLLLVVDRVRTLGGAGAPRQVWHMPARPRLDAVRIIEGSAEDGILESASGDWRMDNATGGQLIGRSLGDGSTRLRAIGGPGHRFWVDGANRESGAEGLDGPPAEPGAWRVELESAAPLATGEGRRDWLLVTAILAQDSDSPDPESFLRRLVVATDPSHAAPILALEVAAGAGLPEPGIFLQSGAVPRQTLGYAALGPGGADSARRLWLADLEAGGRYRWREAGGMAGVFRASPEGRAQLELPLASGEQPAGRLKFGLCPAPAEAGPDWRDLCAELEATEAPPSPPPGPTDPPPSATSLPPSPTAPGTIVPVTIVPGGRLWLPRLERSGR